MGFESRYGGKALGKQVWRIGMTSNVGLETAAAQTSNQLREQPFTVQFDFIPPKRTYLFVIGRRRIVHPGRV
jgi:hypothetical protein